MSTYLIAQINVTQPDRYALYLKDFMKVLTSFGGELLAADHPRVIEGTWPFARTVLMKFPDADALHRWYHSPEYREILRHRVGAAEINLAPISSRD